MKSVGDRTMENESTLGIRFMARLKFLTHGASISV